MTNWISNLERTLVCIHLLQYWKCLFLGFQGFLIKHPRQKTCSYSQSDQTPTTTKWSQNIFRVKLKKGIIFSKNELTFWRNLFPNIFLQEISLQEFAWQELSNCKKSLQKTFICKLSLCKKSLCKKYLCKKSLRKKSLCKKSLLK